MYAQNSFGWTIMMLASCYVDTSIISISNSLGTEAMVSIVEETKVQTIFVDLKTINFVIEQRRKGNLSNLEAIICNEKVNDNEKEDIEGLGIEVFTLDQLIHIGKFALEEELEEIK